MEARERANARLRFRAAAARVARARRDARALIRSDAGPGATMAGTSLWTFGPRSRTRAAVFRVMHSQRMEYAVLGLVLTHFVTLVLLASSAESPRGMSSLAELARSPLRALDVVVLCAYSLEAAARIFSLGFIGHKHAYMASVYNQLDLVIIGVSWLSTAMQWRGEDTLLARVRVGQLRLFRAVHALKRFKLATSVVFIAESMHKSISLLRDVAGLTVVCAVFYALMGMGIFGGSLRRRCVETSSASTARMFYTTVSDPPLFCGDVSNLPDHKGFVCPGVYDSNSSLFCSDLVGNPKHGYQSFDSFGSTLLVMFQTITIEAWQEIMFPIVNAEYKASAAYFVTLIIVGTYFIVSVFVAGVSGVFLRLRREHQMMLRSASKRDDDASSDELESEIAVRKLIRRLNGGTGETVASVAEAALAKQTLMEEDRVEVSAVPSGVARPKRDRLNEFINSSSFDGAVKCCVVANIAVMALYRFDLSDVRKEYLMIAEGFFVSLFALEVLARIIAAKRIIRHLITFNLTSEDAVLILDAFVVAWSAMVIWGKGMNMTSLRILGLFTSVGASKSRSGAETIHRVFRSLGSLLSLFLFYAAILAMYAVLGMQLFANRSAGFEDAPRLNYDTFPQAMLTVFVTSTGEGWTELMFHGLQITKAAIPFYISFFILVNYIILNLIIAVVLENLELRDVEKTLVQSQELVKKAVDTAMRDRRYVDCMERLRVKLILTLRGRRWTMERFHTLSPWLATRFEAENDVRKAMEQEIAESLLQQTSGGHKVNTEYVLCESKFVCMKAPIQTQVRDMAPCGADSLDEPVINSTIARDAADVIGAMDMSEFLIESKAPIQSLTLRAPRSNEKRRVEMMSDDAASDASEFASSATLPWYITDQSLYIFPASGSVRRNTARVLGSNWYSRVDFAFVILSIIAVLATKPVDEHNQFQAQVNLANSAVCGFFALDIALKIITYGFALTPMPFIGSVWNLLDAGIFVIDMMIVGCPIILGAAYTRYWHRAFNMAAPVRPVRIMTRVRSMQRLVKSLVVTLPKIGSIIMLTGAVFLAFGIIAMRQYGGTFYSCNDMTVLNKAECIGTFATADGDFLARAWRRNLFEFDWIGSTMLTLLETASLDGWTEVMFAAMDKTGVDLQPQFNNNWSAAFFFVAFILLGSFLMIRTIIGVFIHQFGLISGRKLLTERQKLWHDMHKVALSLKPIRAKVMPPRGVRRICFYMIHHKMYRFFVLLSVGANVAVMATERYGDSGSVLAEVRTTSEICFVGLYSAEVVLHLLAMYPSLKHYFSNKWNMFELVLAVGSAATLQSRSGSVRDQIGRPFRFLRVFRIVRHVASLQILASTLVLAVPSILSVMGLVLIWIFVYAGIGTQIFPYVKYGEALNKDANFQSFTSSFLLLFQVITGEGWRQYMYDLMLTTPNCVDTETFSDCGFPDGAVLYFVTYVIVMVYVFTNLFVASILDHVTFGVLRESAIITPKHLYQFQETWSRHDPTATGFIGAHRLEELLRDLGAPLAVNFVGKLEGKAPAFCAQAERAAALWRRRIFYESIVHHVPGRGLPFTPMLESLLAFKLGSSALALEARLARHKQLRDIEAWGAAVVAQAHVRGFLTRRQVRIEHSRRRALER